MTSQFKNTTITGTGALVVAQGTADQRPTVTRTVVSYTSGSGTWTVPAGVTNIELLMVGGGGGGGANSGGASYNDGGGGGGAGGLVYKQNYTVTPGAAISYSVGSAGSAGNASRGGDGGNTTFDTLIAYGGGGGGLGGGNTNGGNAAGNNGGSGGGSVNYTGTPAGGSATQPTSGTGGFGNAGSPAGTSASQQAGGGGGAGGAGGIAGYSNASDFRYSGAGGAGLPFDITGTITWYAGGGGGGRPINGLPGAGGIGGGGSGGTQGVAGTAGTANTGGGGGGAGSNQSATAVLGGAGASGVIHIRYVSNITTANSQGIIRYNSTSNAVEVYQNNEWVIQNPATNYAGHNLGTYSEQMGNGVYTTSNCSVTADATTAPDGTVTADKIYENSSNARHEFNKAIATTTGVTYTYSIYVKAAGRNYIALAYAGNPIIGFDLTGSGSVTAGSGSITGTIISLANSWFRISCTFTATSTTASSAIYHCIKQTSSSNVETYTGDGSSGFYLWGSQYEQSAVVGPYNKTVANANPMPTIVNSDQVHSFTTTGTSYWTPAQTGTVEVLVVAGGGGGGYGYYGGGGGAGGLVYLKNYKVTAGTTYTVVVGGGGAGSSSSTARASNGSNSQFGSLIAIGGGGGGSRNNDSAGLPSNGNAGGSGGGGAFPPCIGGAGTAGQGFEGGGSLATSGTYSGYGMGGGGASGPGQSGGWNARYGSQGGGGLGYSISGSLQFYAGGGGGGGNSTGYVDNATAGGIGGGGIGGIVGGISPGAGTANTGGGGGGNGGQAAGGAGGSGIVIVRYKLNTNITGTLDGSSPQRAGISAAAIKTLTSTTTDGYYWINLPVVGPTLVYCDMNTAGGGWMHCATFVDNNEAYNNSYNHPWAAPLHNAQYTGIWQDNSTLGSQSFTSDYKNNVWNYYPMTQQLMKDSGATLRNLWYTGASQITAQSLSTFWGNRQWLASGSDASSSAVSAGRVHYQTITNFGVNDAVFGSSGLDKILFKWGEYDGAQDGNKDRAMISYATGNSTDVDAPKGIGCHTSLSSDYRFRDIVPTAQNTGDSPPNSITGTHALTLWVR